MTTTLNLDHVTRRFGKNVTAVNDVSFSIRDGETVALLGPNGAGKTTLIEMILGFLPTTNGQIACTERISAMLQEGGLLPDLTVVETLRIVSACHRSPTPLHEVIDAAGLHNFTSRRVDKCSGGQKQRLSFTLALLGNPALLLLDEPTTGMDTEARDSFWSQLKQQQRTIVFATHFLAEADAFADRVLIMADGKLIKDLALPLHGKTITGELDGPYSQVVEDEEVEGVVEKLLVQGLTGLTITPITVEAVYREAMEANR